MLIIGPGEIFCKLGAGGRGLVCTLGAGDGAEDCRLGAGASGIFCKLGDGDGAEACILGAGAGGIFCKLDAGDGTEACRLGALGLAKDVLTAREDIWAFFLIENMCCVALKFTSAKEITVSKHMIKDSIQENPKCMYEYDGNIK